MKCLFLSGSSHCLVWLVFFSLTATASEIPASDSASFQTKYMKWAIGTNGKNISLIDKSSGRDFIDKNEPGAFAEVVINSKTYPATALQFHGQKIEASFGSLDVSAVFQVEEKGDYLTIETIDFKGSVVEELHFPNISLTLTGKMDEPFGCCLLSLNLQTDVQELPGPSRYLNAIAYNSLGFTGTKVAMASCPQTQLRTLIQEIVLASDELPHSPLGGPWAKDAPINYGSYLIDTGTISLSNVDEWVQLSKSLGFEQIDFHTGQNLRFGDLAPNPKMYPNGLADVKTVIDRLHAAGIKAGLHTYAQFINKDTPWVTPIPDPGLAKKAAFTLAQALPAESTEVYVEESTENVSVITGFQVRNSVTLQIDNELIVFSDVSKTPPYAFNKCERGACGTSPVSHAAGTPVYQLAEVFGLFVPDGDSELAVKVAERTAEVYNKCGFDMIYLDALDGSDAVTKDHRVIWHYSAKFAFDIWKRLERPALMEMSAMTHHLWYLRSRANAGDMAARGYKPFIDWHTLWNEEAAKSMLPQQLGWWGAYTWNGIQPERSFPDDFEYLLCKSLANDNGLSMLAGFNTDLIQTSYNSQRLAALIKRYETIRRTSELPEKLREALSVRGAEYTLEECGAGELQFRPITYSKHKITGMDSASDQWTEKNPYGKQNPRIRIEALLGLEAYDTPGCVVLEDFSSPESFTRKESREGVASTFSINERQCDFAVSNLSAETDGAWAVVGKTFAAPINMNNMALGLWVQGDGKGQVLNIQLANEGLGYLSKSDHYIKADFIGWKYIELVEPESDHIADYDWPYCRRRSDWETKGFSMMDAYTNYHFHVYYNKIASMHIWMNNVPQNETAKCSIGPIEAIPTRKIMLKKPSITIGGKKLLFDTELESGCYIEFVSMKDCKVYGPEGEIIKELTPQGDELTILPGENSVQFDAEAEGTYSARAQVTLITLDKPIPLKLKTRVSSVSNP